MPQARLRLLAVLAAIAAAIAAAASWSSRPAPVSPVASIDAGARAGAVLEAIQQALAAITDDASATTALPRLRAESAKLVDIRDIAEGSPSERAKIARKLAPLLPDFDARSATALKAAGVEPVAGPVLRQISERLKFLASGG